MNDSPMKIGENLNLSEEDVKQVKEAGEERPPKFPRKVVTLLASFVSFVVGFFLGTSSVFTENPVGYPYAATLAGGSVAGENKKLHTIARWILPFVVSIISFLIGFILGVEIRPSPYPTTSRYGVYRKRKG